MTALSSTELIILGGQDARDGFIVNTETKLVEKVMDGNTELHSYGNICLCAHNLDS